MRSFPSKVYIRFYGVSQEGWSQTGFHLVFLLGIFRLGIFRLGIPPRYSKFWIHSIMYFRLGFHCLLTQEKRHTSLPPPWARGQWFYSSLFTTHSLGTSSSVLDLYEDFISSCSHFLVLWLGVQSLCRAWSPGSVQEGQRLVPTSPWGPALWPPLHFRHWGIPVFYTYIGHDFVIFGRYIYISTEKMGNSSVYQLHGTGFSPLLFSSFNFISLFGCEWENYLFKYNKLIISLPFIFILFFFTYFGFLWFY